LEIAAYLLIPPAATRLCSAFSRLDCGDTFGDHGEAHLSGHQLIWKVDKVRAKKETRGVSLAIECVHNERQNTTLRLAGFDTLRTAEKGPKERSGSIPVFAGPGLFHGTAFVLLQTSA